MIVNAAELQAVKDALDRDDLNGGVGVLHEPSGRVFLAPFDTVPGGHVELAANGGLPPVECKGFAIAKDARGGFAVANISHLNGPQGQPGSLQMPQTTFDAIQQALRDAGL